MTPRLSVVIPAYNNAAFIAATMRSILKQDFTDFELVVADHSSQDGTMDVLRPFEDDARVRLITTPAGGGAERNWRRVSDEAVGEYVKLVCGDDVLYPGALTSHVTALESDPAVALVASKRDILDAAGAPLVAGRGLGRLDGRVAGGTAIRASVRAGANIFGEPACVTMRRNVFVDAGGWDGRFPYLIDQASYARVLERGDLFALRAPAAGFRVNAGQWSVALAADQARQARKFHHDLRARRPDLVSPADVALGDLRAGQTAFARRAVYIVFASRLRTPVTVES